MVAGDPAERVRERRVAAGIVERMTGLVHERLVIVQATLGAGDQVDDLRRIGGDHACARRLLRSVVEVEADVPIGRDVEPERAQRLQADVGRAVLRVGAVERRQAADVPHVCRRWLGFTFRPEQAFEPRFPQLEERCFNLLARRPQHSFEVA